ncbi:hypothetical protein AMECASPLE_007130 [Ameca splendens]|uniref:Uncharacterized protein n=1 Tax=Ameca splendens TaxID=208324 RepID=A0ABV0YLP4_9TELE
MSCQRQQVGLNSQLKSFLIKTRRSDTTNVSLWLQIIRSFQKHGRQSRCAAALRMLDMLKEVKGFGSRVQVSYKPKKTTAIRMKHAEECFCSDTAALKKKQSQFSGWLRLQQAVGGPSAQEAAQEAGLGTDTA